jgi:DnaJ-domain-containing protein 1
MPSDIADPFGVLGLSRTATPDELKGAYRRLVKAWHPDRHSSGSDTQRMEADRRFKLINAAYVTVGEMLRERAIAETAAAQEATERSDVRIEAIRSVVASAALRIIPNVPRHTYRRVVSAVEAILIDTIAVGDRAFSQGFEVAVAEAMDFVALATTSRDDLLHVLDAAADDLQWRGKGADPRTWQTLLRPLEVAMRPPASRPTNPVTAHKPMPPSSRVFQPRELVRAAQAMLAIVFVACLIPGLPLNGTLRFIALVADLSALGYLTFGVRAI